MFRNRLLSRFPKEDFSALAPHMREVALGPGETIISAGSAVGTLYFPSSAVISEVIVLEDGRMLETNTVGLEGATGLMPILTGTPSLTRSFAQISGSAIVIDAKVIMGRLVESPDLLSLMMRGLMLVHVQSQQSAACRAYHVLPRRLARWLLATADRTGSLKFPLTQEYMAVMAGTQRTSVNATAADLKRRGLIDYSRGNVTILDRPALERQACECYRAVHEMEEEIGGAPLRPFGT